MEKPNTDTPDKTDVIVEVSDEQLALPMENKADLAGNAEEVKIEPEPKKERKRHNDDAIKSVEAQLRQKEAELEAERGERQRIASELARAKAAEAEARGHVAQSDYERVQGYLAAAKSKEDSLKRDIRQASELGEHERLAELQMEAARVAARKLQYEDAKQSMEIQAQQDQRRRPAETEAEPERFVHRDPFEARIAALSPKSQAWLREHPECVTDDVTNSKVLWGHKAALKSGLRVDTPEYFSFLDQHMGYAEALDDGDDEVEIEAPSVRRAAPAAPVSRDSRMGQVAPGKYRLSREEAETATQLGMTPTEYATWKIKAIKDGRYTA